MRTLLCAALLTVPVLAQSTALDNRIRAQVAQFPGKVSLTAKNLDTGASYEYGADDRVRTASTIKLPVMVECFAAVAEGRLKWAEELTFTKENRVSGSGVLTEFSEGVRLPVRDVMHLMIVVSDNSATNMIIDKVTADAVNARMESLGLKQTHLLRKVMNSGSASGVSRYGKMAEYEKYGLGVTTPREMVLLLEKLEKGEVVSPEASREMLAVLKRQQDRAGIARQYLNTPIASKTGALDHLRSDVAIAYSKGGRIALAITCEGIPEVNYNVDNAGLLLISSLAKTLIDGLAH